MTDRLFHLMPPANAEALLRGSGPWRPPSLASEGFVHLSFAHQLPGTLATHYADAEALTLVEVSREATSDALRLEVSRGDALFPHLYRALERTDVVATWPLERDASGWELPPLA